MDTSACANRNSFLTQTHPSHISNLLKLMGNCDLRYLSSDKYLSLLQCKIKPFRPSLRKELNMWGWAQIAVSASKSENYMQYILCACICLGWWLSLWCANLVLPDGPKVQAGFESFSEKLPTSAVCRACSSLVLPTATPTAKHGTL